MNCPLFLLTSPGVWLKLVTGAPQCLGRQVRRTQFRDYPQDVGEQVSWNGHLRHLEGKVAAMADDLRTYLDEAFAVRRAS